MPDKIRQAFEAYRKKVGRADVCSYPDFDAGARWALDAAAARLEEMAQIATDRQAFVDVVGYMASAAAVRKLRSKS